VILGCDSGERGWESEELKRTAFAHAVIESLSGKAAASADNFVTALDLFNAARESTKNWTRQNRPTTQNPILLPSGDVGLQRAGETKLTLYHPISDKAVSPVDPLPMLKKRWEAYGELANANKPGPEVYTPRRWRRYRELLLRYEFIARSGQDTALGALEAELDKEARAIRSAQQAGFIGASRTASVPMWQASGQSPAIAGSYDLELRVLGSRFLGKPSTETLRDFKDQLLAMGTHRVAYSNDLIQAMLKSPPENLTHTRRPSANSVGIGADPPAGCPIVPDARPVLPAAGR
jgi:hypothetical protein